MKGRVDILLRWIVMQVRCSITYCALALSAVDRPVVLVITALKAKGPPDLVSHLVFNVRHKYFGFSQVRHKLSMNQKRGEITCFLDHELLPQAKPAFDQYRPEDITVIEAA